jgi:hypothetical protein
MTNTPDHTTPDHTTPDPYSYPYPPPGRYPEVDRYPGLEEYMSRQPARLPRLRIDRTAIQKRYTDCVHGPTNGFRTALVRSVADVPVLLFEVDRLWLLLVAARRRYANLVAAGRATLAAHADGEADPLSYLRDELPPNPGTGPAAGRWGRR